MITLQGSDHMPNTRTTERGERPAGPVAATVLVLAGFLLLAALTLPPGLVAQDPEGEQALTGRVVEAGTGSGIEGVILEVFDEDGARVGMGLTGNGGRFRVALVRSGGPFLLQVFAMSHEQGEVEDIHVRPDEVLELDDIVLEAAPVQVDTLRVQVQGRLTGRERVRRRQLLGQGTFLAGAVIQQDNPYYLTNYVAEAAGLMVRFGVRGRSARLENPRSIRPCMTVHVNHWPISQSGFGSLDEIPLRWIAAVEIYNTWDETPEDARMMSNTDWGGCGLVNVWLWNSW